MTLAKVIVSYLLLLVLPSFLLIWAAYLALPVVLGVLRVDGWPDIAANAMTLGLVIAAVVVVWAYHRQVAPRWRRWAQGLLSPEQSLTRTSDQ